MPLWHARGAASWTARLSTSEAKGLATNVTYGTEFAVSDR
jgi:hypothetical protein